MKPSEIVNFLNTDATDAQFAEVFALLEISMCGRGIPQVYDTESIILNMNVDTICNKLKSILKEIQKKAEDGFLNEFLCK